MDIIKELKECIIELGKDGVNSKANVRSKLANMLNEVEKREKQYKNVNKSCDELEEENDILIKGIKALNISKGQYSCYAAKGDFYESTTVYDADKKEFNAIKKMLEVLVND